MSVKIHRKNKAKRITLIPRAELVKGEVYELVDSHGTDTGFEGHVFITYQVDGEVMTINLTGNQAERGTAYPLDDVCEFRLLCAEVQLCEDYDEIS